MSPAGLRRALIAYNGADAGLGNRVRVVLGCQRLAEYEHRQFCYVWPTGPLFQPRLDELWDFRDGRVVPRALSRGLARLFPYEDADARHSPGAEGGPYIRQVRTGAEILLPEGAASWKDSFRALTPVDEIGDVVRRLWGEGLAGTPYIGVQVRAHAVSHQVTKDTSPVDWFERRMAEVAERRPGVPFFLSCDVPEVYDRLAARIPGCIGIRDKGPYNSTAAVRGAIADLYLLAGSGHLIAPHGSSFVLLATYLAEERLSIETPVSRGSGEIDVAGAGLVQDPMHPARRVASA